VAKFYPNFSG